MRVHRHQHPHFDSPKHADAAETMFFERALTFVEAQVLYKLIPELKGRTFVETNRNDPEGTERTEYRMITRVGRAAFSTTPGDAPMSSFYQETFGHKYWTIRGAYQYTYDELIAAQLASRNSQAQGGPPINIDLENATACMEGMATTLDIVCAFGTSQTVPTSIFPASPIDLGLLGLLNQPYASTYVIPNGAAGSPLWSAKTPDEVVADLTGIVTYQITSTFTVHSPKRIIVDVGSYRSQLVGRRMGDGSDETILAFFQRTSKESEQPVEVRSWIMNAGAGPAGTNLMLAYDPAERNVALKVSQEFTQMTLEYRDETYKVPCRARTAGVIARRPLSMTYASGF